MKLPTSTHSRECGSGPTIRHEVGEVLPLRREDFDGETLKVRRTAHEGAILQGTKTDHGEQDAGRTVPVPATLAWMLEAQINLNGPDCDLLFTTPTGRMWRERNFYRDVWKPAQQALEGLDHDGPVSGLSAWQALTASVEEAVQAL
jgi:hypothetical protein